MFYFYIPEGIIGVTSFYIGIITEAIERLGEQIVLVKRLKDIPKHSNVFTITDKAATFVKLSRNPRFLVNWFQGISPEEMDMIYEGKAERFPRKIIRTATERYAIKHCSLNIFVSEAMLSHYRQKYGYNGSNYFIMPCFGNGLDKTVFVDSRYEHPNFLYSGSTFKWQCLDEMLELFKLIKSRIPEASLTIFTPSKEIEIARKLIKDHEVDANVDSVSPNELQEVIKTFKYGFIVREDTAVNQVATPTKMSNYMGAGIIPVYSDVVRDYKKHITGNSPYLVSFSSKEECIDKLLNLETQTIASEEILKSYESIFSDYWDRETYILQLMSVLNQYL